MRHRAPWARATAVTVVHSETSTMALTDVRAITAVARAHGALCLIDSVTGLGGVPLAFDADGYDFVLTGSQKALAMPPGLAFGVASEAYVRAMRDTPERGLYFDLVEFEEYAAKHQTPNTPALTLLYAAEAQLAHIVAETMPARWARHAAMAAATHAWVAERGAPYGLGILAPEGERSPTVTAITVPEGVSTDAIVKGVAARGFVIGSGYGKLKARTFRIGHMGDHTVDGVVACLAAVEETLAHMHG